MEQSAPDESPAGRRAQPHPSQPGDEEGEAQQPRVEEEEEEEDGEGEEGEGEEGAFHAQPVVGEGRLTCKYGAKCYRKNPDHIARFHPEKMAPSPDRRVDCKYGASCYQKNPEHRRKYRHPNETPRHDPSRASPAARQGGGQREEGSAGETQPVCRWGADCKYTNPFHRIVEAHPNNNNGNESENGGLPPSAVQWEQSTPEVRLLYHATSFLDQIQGSGYVLKPGPSGALCFSETVTSARDRARGSGPDVVVLAYRVFVGRQLVGRGAAGGMRKDKLWGMGLDSVKDPGDASAASGPQWFVYDPRQAELAFVAHSRQATSRTKEFARGMAQAAAKLPSTFPLVPSVEVLGGLCDQVVRAPHPTDMTWNVFQAARRAEGVSPDDVRRDFFAHYTRAQPRSSGSAGRSRNEGGRGGQPHSSQRSPSEHPRPSGSSAVGVGLPSHPSSPGAVGAGGGGEGEGEGGSGGGGGNAA